ncbi:hypothetical protein KSS87_001446 [Heliosperma pusillum]|nr:hypothetical protein KSS87_001446 [Heliosperma pusillum]
MMKLSNHIHFFTHVGRLRNKIQYIILINHTNTTTFMHITFHT